jgi:hypothetical protein
MNGGGKITEQRLTPVTTKRRRRKTHIESIMGDGGLEDGDWEIRFLWKLKTSKPRGENVKKNKKEKKI